MGQMCTNPLQYLITQYGEDVAKFIVIQKSKEMIDEKYPDVRKKLQGQTQEFKKQVTENVDKQSKQSLEKMTTQIDDFKKKKQNEIKTFETTKGQKLDEIIGVNKMQDEFGQIKTKGEAKIGQVSTGFLSQTDKLVEEQKKKMDESKPKLPLYENLPQCLKDKVFEQGQVKFGGAIEEGRKKQEEFISNVGDFEKFKSSVGQTPDKQIQGITEKYQGSFDKAKTLVSGGGFLSGIFG